MSVPSSSEGQEKPLKGIVIDNTVPGGVGHLSELSDVPTIEVSTDKQAPADEYADVYIDDAGYLAPGCPGNVGLGFSSRLSKSPVGSSISGAVSKPVPIGSPRISKDLGSPVVETSHISLEYDPIRKRKMLNTYEIISDLGSGRHGKVKLAYDSAKGEKVAIKVLDRNGKGRIGQLDETLQSENEYRIRKEVAIMKKCNHDNVVKLREVIDDPRLRKVYLVLEYLEKGEIDWQIEELLETSTGVESIFRPVLTFKESRLVFRDVILGLEYLHFQGIIHRDIKPANLLISKHNVVKISDFGVSFSINFSDYTEYELCKTAGTPAFYAPELCGSSDDGRPRITHKVDIWALGVTLYCLMFGKLPFYGKNDFELFAAINKAEFEIPSFQEYQSFEISQNYYLLESTYNDMADLIRKMLVKDPDRRIDIPDIKQHAYLLSSLVTSEEKYQFENNIQIFCNTDVEKIDVSTEEMGAAITDIRGKIRSGISKVLNFAFTSSGSLSSKKSLPSLGVTKSRTNTIYTPPQEYHLGRQNSSLSLNVDNTPSLYNNTNNTNPSFLSTTLNHSSLEYFPSVYDRETPIRKSYGSQLSLKSKDSIVRLATPKNEHPRQALQHLRSSSINTHVSDTKVEAGFMVHTNPVANTLNGIMKKAGEESPLASPPIRSLSNIFGLGTRLSANIGGDQTPKGSSRVSLPLNSSYASLNSIDDELLYTKYKDKGSASGFINKGSTSGFFNNINTNNDFKFHEVSIREKIYGKKNRDYLKASEECRPSKLSSISTINEVESKKNLAMASLKPESDPEDDYILFTTSRYKDRTGSGAESINTDIDSCNTSNRQLRMVDSIVTVPNSIISRMQSGETTHSQTHLSKYVMDNSSSVKDRKKPKQPRNSKFQFGNDDSDSEYSDDSQESPLFFNNFKGKPRRSAGSEDTSEWR